MAYAESRARFGESLDVMRLAWTQERFSSPGTFDTFRDMVLIPKPSQHPHPPYTMPRPHAKPSRPSARWDARCSWVSRARPWQNSPRALWRTRRPGRRQAILAPGQCHALLRARATSLPPERPDVQLLRGPHGPRLHDSHLCGRVAHARGVRRPRSSRNGSTCCGRRWVCRASSWSRIAGDASCTSGSSTPCACSHPGGRSVCAGDASGALTSCPVQTIAGTRSLSGCARSRDRRGARWRTGVDARSLGPAGS